MLEVSLAATFGKEVGGCGWKGTKRDFQDSSIALFLDLVSGSLIDIFTLYNSSTRIGMIWAFQQVRYISIKMFGKQIISSYVNIIISAKKQNT